MALVPLLAQMPLIPLMILPSSLLHFGTEP
jgi:hypothetical protein